MASNVAETISKSELGFRRKPFLANAPSTPELWEICHEPDYVQRIRARPLILATPEHSRLGDTLRLQLADKTFKPAKEVPFTLENGLQLTYGEINALAGDFYAGEDPICMPKEGTTHEDAFIFAFNTLNKLEASKKEAEDLINTVLNPELDILNETLKWNQDHPSEKPRDIAAALNQAEEDETKRIDDATPNRFLNSVPPSYKWISWWNLDHFGDDARTAYTTGHQAAMKLAASWRASQKKDPALLQKAYIMNAFADHFLEDLFSAGHLRVPRRALHGVVDPNYDLCCIQMHNEDSAIGLRVYSQKHREVWTAYGDNYAYEGDNSYQLDQCRSALHASVQDIYNAWDSGNPISTHSPLDWVPIPNEGPNSQPLAPLFKLKNPGDTSAERRKFLSQRRDWTDYVPESDSWFGSTDGNKNWSPSTTLTECDDSGLFKFPIKMN